MLKRIANSIGIGLVILACLFFVAGQTFDFLVFKYQQNTIRKEIKSQIKSGVDENELHIFEITPAFLKKIKWTKAGKEFRINNRLFDVVKREHQNGKFVLKCINDIQETELFAQLENQIKNRLAQNEANDDYYKNLAKDFVKNIFVNQKVFQLFPNAINSKFAFIEFSSNYIRNFFPPPNKIV